MFIKSSTNLALAGLNLRASLIVKIYTPIAIKYGLKINAFFCEYDKNESEKIET